MKLLRSLKRFLAEPVSFSAEWKFLLLLITFGIITNYAAWAVAVTFLEGP